MSETDARILLVEDAVDFTDEFVKYCEGNNWVFDVYRDVGSATLAIARAQSDGWDYDAAILDFYLPRSPSDLERPVDESLCRTLRHITLVWHISAHFAENEVQQHVRICHSPDEQIAMLDKLDHDLVPKLRQQIKQALATRRIKTSLAKLQADGLDSAYSRRLRPDSATDSVTTLFGRLCADIKRFWKELTPAFQSELQEVFEIECDGDGRVQSVYPK